MAPRLCELIDPDHPDYRPAYRDSIISAAMQADPSAYPPIAQQARNLARALWEWATAGFTVADEAEVARRLAICRPCPNWRDGRCALCGCALAWKVRMRTEHCPIDQW
jgi:hypothetical protein